jgi:hypothetical protein
LQHLTEFYIPTYIPKFPRYMQFFKKSNSWYRRTETQHSNFDQWAGEGIQLCTKSFEIGFRTWSGSGRKSRKALCSWCRFWASNSWQNSTNAEISTPVTRQQIKHYDTSQFQTPITRSLVNLFVLRHLDNIIDTKSVTQENERLPVS